jgi:hypothetical protein
VLPVWPCSMRSGLSTTLAAPSGKSHRSSALVRDARVAGYVALIRRNATQWPLNPVCRYFAAFLARSWAEGTTKVRHLFSAIRHRGYTGS